MATAIIESSEKVLSRPYNKISFIDAINIGATNKRKEFTAQNESIGTKFSNKSIEVGVGDNLDVFSQLPSFEQTSKTSFNYSMLTQKWIGHVTQISGDVFSARLKDLSSGGTDEEAEFDVSDIPQEDIPLLKLGAAFYWNVGKASYNGQYKTESFIRFQRLRDWDESDMDAAADRAHHLSSKATFE
jgi:hypothetical protein